MLLEEAVEATEPRAVALDPQLARELEERVADAADLAFRVALGVLRRREDAEDVAQEAFLRAHRSFPAIRDRERFRSWLVRVAFRLALDRERGEKRRTRREEVVALGEAARLESVEEAAIRSQMRGCVLQAVDALPEKLRITILLSAIQGHGTAEVAALLGVPEGTVKSRLHLARKALAEKLRWLAKIT